MPLPPEPYTLHRALGLDSITARTLHDIARLRQEIFVVEQECPYLDLDGRDAEATTEQFWIAHEGARQTHLARARHRAMGDAPAAPAAAATVVATLRVLDESGREPGLHAVGRVATSAAHRGKALGAALLEAVIDAYGNGPLVLDAQSHLTHWYGRFGFAPAGAEFLEDGIPHTPMRRG